MMMLNLFKDVPDYRRSSKLQEQILKKPQFRLLFLPGRFSSQQTSGGGKKNGSGPYIRVLLVDNEGFEYATTLRLK
jgi:hypothetical protein